MRVAALAVAVTFVVAGCGARVETGASPSLSASASAAAQASPPATPGPSPTSHTVAFPDLPFIVGTSSGDLFFQLQDGQPTGRKVQACADSFLGPK